jgi:BirA family biotin operon repressor/biotin-[acetyl-CoA-carboxylase] ligase
VTGPFSDLERPPLRAPALRSALLTADGLWSDLRVVEETGSTNADVAAAAAAGAPEGLVVVAEHQRAGRGRVDRAWTAPARSGLTFSVLLRPPATTRPAWGWLPLLTGLSVATPLTRQSGLDVGLKWPNDVLIGTRKVAGLLAEVMGDAVVLGVGLNVSLREDELPVPTATSLRLAGSEVVDREPVLRAVLRDLAARYLAWRQADGDAAASGLLADYRAACVTIGREVTVHLPGGRAVAGRACDVDGTGRLLVETGAGVEALAAGDVVHLR